MEAWWGQCQLAARPAPGGQLVRGSVSGGLVGPVSLNPQTLKPSNPITTLWKTKSMCCFTARNMTFVGKNILNCFGVLI